MAERLMGLETEYALSVATRSGETCHDRSKALEALFLFAKRRPHLPAMVHKGYFLENGALLYLDCGNHVEYATPECLSPEEVVCYQLTGERLLSEMTEELIAADNMLSDLAFFKHNVDYSGSRSTWGCHESYLHKANARLLSEQIIPHLVSRIIYTGAGGFNPLTSGLEFLLSPRVEFLVKVLSSESMRDRGIFHTKDEPLCNGGYHRLHLICGESNCSEKATFLKMGTTAIVVAMIEAGLQPGNGVKLRAPIGAMRTFSRDPACRRTVEKVNGRPVTALEIQRHYLAHAERNLREPFMPTWAEEVTQAWRSVLDLLEQGAPDSAVAILDWPLKLAIFKDHVHRKGLSWEQIGLRNYALSEAEIRGKSLPGKYSGRPFNSLRQELFEIDMRVAQVGAKGIFTVLDNAGYLDHRIAEAADIEEALKAPPKSGRARLRGDCIKRFAAKGHLAVCDWDKICDTENHRMLDLSNPFERKEQWKNLPKEKDDLLAMNEIVFRAFNRTIQFRHSRR